MVNVTFTPNGVKASNAANTVKILSPDTVKQGDTKNDFLVQLIKDGVPLDLTGKTVTWSAASNKGKFVTDRAATVEGDGTVGIEFTGDDVGATGSLRVEFKVTYADGDVEKFPAQNYAYFEITRSLDDLGHTPVLYASVQFFEDKVAEVKTGQEAFEQTVDGKIVELESTVQQGIGAFTEDTEVVMARGGEVNLGARLDKTTAQLADTGINAKKPPAPFNAAKGDNSTDDSAVLNSLFEYCRANNLKMFLPKGIYICTSQILSMNCDVVGYGIGTEIHGRVLIGSNIQISNLSFVINANGDGITVKGTSSNRLNKVNIDNIKVRFSSTTDVTYRHAISGLYTDRLTIRNSDIQYGINLASCSDFLLENNVIDGDGFKNNSELLHITLKSSGTINSNTFKNTGDDFIDLFSAGEQVIITNNRFLGCKSKWGQGIEIKVSLSDDTNNTSSPANGYSESIIIANNIFKGFYPPANAHFYGINIYRIDNRSTPVSSLADCPKNILIENNIIEGYTDEEASITSAYFTGIRVVDAWGIEITNNTIRDIKTKQTTQYRNCGISLNGTRHIKVKDNTLIAMNGCAMNIYNDNEDLQIVGNKTYTDYTLNQKAKIGVYVRGFNTGTIGNLKSSIIKDNSFEVLEAPLKSLVAESVLLNTDIIGNKFKGGLDIYLDQIVGSKIKDNKFHVFGLMLGGSVSGATLKQNIINGNHFIVNGVPGLTIRNLQGSQVKDNQFIGTTSAIKMYDVTKNNLIKDNLSSEQSTATTIWNINVPQADYDTNTFVDNKRII